MTFDEGTNTVDTVSFTGCTDSTLTLTLGNDASASYSLSETEGLDLRLATKSQTISLTFQVDSSTWPSGSTATVKLDDGDSKSLPHTFSDKPTGSTFHVTITTPSAAMITWDPKIKVIPPIRAR